MNLRYLCLALFAVVALALARLTAAAGTAPNRRTATAPPPPRHRLAARGQAVQRASPRLPAAGQQLDGQQARFPLRTGDPAQGRRARSLRRDLRHSAHPRGQGDATASCSTTCRITKSDFPFAARPRRRLLGGVAEAIRARRAQRVARPVAAVTGARRDRGARRGRAEQRAEGDRQQHAGDPGADRRHRPCCSRLPKHPALPARHQHAGR